MRTAAAEASAAAAVMHVGCSKSKTAVHGGRRAIDAWHRHVSHFILSTGRGRILHVLFKRSYRLAIVDAADFH